METIILNLKIKTVIATEDVNKIIVEKYRAWLLYKCIEKMSFLSRNWNNVGPTILIHLLYYTYLGFRPLRHRKFNFVYSHCFLTWNNFQPFLILKSKYLRGNCHWYATEMAMIWYWDGSEYCQVNYWKLWWVKIKPK